jgi:hypothetical protein
MDYLESQWLAIKRWDVIPKAGARKILEAILRLRGRNRSKNGDEYEAEFFNNSERRLFPLKYVN